MRRYAAISVAVPALPGCTSQGETREEALPMIREAIEAYVESLVAHGNPIPRAGRDRASHRRGVTPRLPAVTPRQAVPIGSRGATTSSGIPITPIGSSSSLANA